MIQLHANAEWRTNLVIDLSGVEHDIINRSKVNQSICMEMTMSNAKFQRDESDDRFDDQSARGVYRSVILLPEHIASTPPLLSVLGKHFEAKSLLTKRKLTVAFALLVCAVVTAAVFPVIRGADAAPSSAHDETESTAKPVHIVYSSDENSLAGVEASIRSVKAHASGPVVFHFIGDAPLRNMPDVHFKPLSHIARKYHLEDYMNPEYERGHGVGDLNTNPANYVRFAIDEFLPKQSKAMWIDADTIVNCDVVSLVNNVLNDGTKTIAAVPREGQVTGLSKKGRHKYAYIETSFNAGIYVINLDNWRAQGISEKIRKIALRNRETLIYKHGSQPPMAIAIEENFEHLPPTWNVAMSGVEEVNAQLLEEMCLMHWKGPFKPWNKDNKKDYYVELWLQYGEQVDKKETRHDYLRRSVLEVENMAG